MLFTKSKDWQYEREWRIANHLAEADRLENHPKLGKLHFFNLPPDCIKGIIFGCQMTIEDREYLANLTVSDARYNSIRLSHAVMSESTYNLDLKSWPD